MNYSKLQQRNGLVDLPKPTVQMTFEEVSPVDDALPPVEDAPNPRVMLSTEIAALLNKNHYNVLRDIDVIIGKLKRANQSFNCTSSSYINSVGHKYRCYELDCEASMLVATSYGIPSTLKMMEHWKSIIEVLKSQNSTVEAEPVIEEAVVEEAAPEVKEAEPVKFEIEIYAKPIGSDEVNTVNARELHGKLKVESKFADWIKRRINECDFKDSFDFILLKNKKVQIEGGREVSREVIDYFISLDMAKELSMVENNAQGKAARRYFIECEKVAKGEIQKVEQKPQSSLIEKIKTTSEIVDVTMVLLQRLGIEGNQAALGATAFS